MWISLHFSLPYKSEEESGILDSPLKRFAQRFTYNGIDEIALRNLGFRVRSRPSPLPQPQPQPNFTAMTGVIGGVSFSPVQKRSAPESSRSPPKRRESFDRSRSPTRSDHGSGAYKRYRAASPPPRRFPLPERDRVPRYNGPPPRERERERSPLPLSLPLIPRREDRAPLPPPPAPAPLPLALQPRDQLDRSGLTKPLAWFIASLPSARSFDGEYFPSTFSSPPLPPPAPPPPPPPPPLPAAPALPEINGDSADLSQVRPFDLTMSCTSSLRSRLMEWGCHYHRLLPVRLISPSVCVLSLASLCETPIQC